MAKYLLLILTICTFQLHAQNKFSNIDFKEIDSFARTIKYDVDLFSMTKQLTSRYSTPIEKLRSIFMWITDNIAYDCSFLNGDNEPEKFECDDESKNCADDLRRWEMKYINRLLKRKKDICQGYAMLLKKMCDIGGVDCEIVTGYTKTKPYQVGIPLPVDHAWNAVQIDSVYYFVDATWAAGFCPTCLGFDDVYCKYVKSFKEYYWLTPFDKLVRNHYPDNGKFVMTPSYTKEKFFNNIYFYGHYALVNLDVESPKTGVIEARLGDTIHFKFRYTGDSIRQLQINTNILRNPAIDYFENYGRRNQYKRFVHDTLAIKKQIYLPFKQTGNLYEVDYVVTNTALYVLDILFEHRFAMKYKFKIME